MILRATTSLALAPRSTNSKRYRCHFGCGAHDLDELWVKSLAIQVGSDWHMRLPVTGGSEAGWLVNDKRVERIWRREGLKVPHKQPKRGRLWLSDGSCIRLRPEQLPNSQPPTPGGRTAVGDADIMRRVKRLKEFEQENSRLRRAVSDLTLDKLILQEAARGNF